MSKILDDLYQGNMLYHVLAREAADGRDFDLSIIHERATAPDRPSPDEWYDVIGKAKYPEDVDREDNGVISAAFGAALSYLAQCDRDVEAALLANASALNLAMIRGESPRDGDGPAAVPAFPALYETLPAYRYLHDSVTCVSWADLATIHSLIGPEKAMMSPAAYMEHRGDEIRGCVQPGRRGRLFANATAGIDYLMMASFDASRASGEAFLKMVEADPAGIAHEAGVFGAMFAKVELMKRGMSQEDANANLVVEMMDRVEDMAPEDQARIVAEVRKNVMESPGVMLINPEDLGDEEHGPSWPAPEV